jgi:Ca2+-binding EF-hand superfamily protein
MQKKFTIDKQEYQSVFRVIDQDNSGRITIEQVNTCLEKIDNMHRTQLQKLEAMKKAAEPKEVSKQKASTKGYLRGTVV